LCASSNDPGSAATATLDAAANSAGGEGAPDLQETLQNFGINAAALAVLSFFVLRDVSSQNKDQQVITREEALGKLQVGGSEWDVRDVLLQAYQALVGCCMESLRACR
jgi:hypothetical protein